MTIAVEGSGFLQTAASLEDANHLAALYYEALADELQSYGAMAGDASIADDFAAAYDEAAAGCIATLADVVASLASLGELTRATVENHRRGDEGSLLGTRLSLDGWLPDAGYVEVVIRTLPSALGGDASSLPGWANVVLDHVEGFVWPDADTDRLREAAQTWRTVFQADVVASYCDIAVDGLALERSPEVPAAEAAISDLATTIRSLGDQLESIASSCETYAEQVEAQREEILDLVRDLIRDAAIIQGVGIVIGVFTAGGAAGAAVAANAAKFAAAAPRFMRIIATLRTLASATAGTIRTATTTVSFLKLRLVGFVGAKAVIAKHVGFAGALELARWAPGWLATHEVRGSHTLEKHVGKSDDWLRQRLLENPNFKAVSTFTDAASAEKALETLLKRENERLTTWLATTTDEWLVLEGEVRGTDGQIITRDGAIRQSDNVRVLIAQDGDMPGGYRIHTSYVIP